VDAAVDRYRISAERVADELARLAFTRMPQLANVCIELEPDGTQRQRLIVKNFATADPERLGCDHRDPTGRIRIDGRRALFDFSGRKRAFPPTRAEIDRFRRSGYSRLIGLDDVGTLERLRTLRELGLTPASGFATTGLHGQVNRRDMAKTPPPHASRQGRRCQRTGAWSGDSDHKG
jgi:hypothetical protein